MNIIKVNNCQDCPFVNIDNEYGYNECCVKKIKLGKWEELPASDAHKECPLKEKDFAVKLQDFYCGHEYVQCEKWCGNTDCG